jgi:hypothetical protein
MRVSALLLLVPVATAIAIGFAQSTGLWAAAVTIGMIVNLQFGYLLGASARPEDALA